MRYLRLSLVGAVTLAMFGGVGGAAFAQDDADAMVGFTMKITDEGYGYWGDAVGFVWQVEASDPRLSGTWKSDQNCVEDSTDTVCVASVRVENDGGSWLGRYENSGGVMQPRWVAWTMLEGQGDYAGLTAFMYSDDTMDLDRELDGAGHIVATLPMPGMPPAE